MEKMSPGLVDECISCLCDSTGVQLTEKQFFDLMEDDHYFVRQLIKIGSPRDTMDRECLMDVIAKKLTGRSWPTYGEGDEAYNSFIQQFNSSAIEKGYTLVA